jgi:hypothetical protein
MKKIAAFLSAVLLVLVLSVQAQQPPPTSKGKPPKLKGVDRNGKKEVDDTFKEKKAKKFRQHHRRHRRHKGE